MNRYFSCFSKRKPLPPKQPIILAEPLKIKVPTEDILEGELPTSLDELKLLEFKVANRMSHLNGVANRIHADYMYTLNRKNLSRAVHLQRLHMERVKEVRRHSARLLEINEAIEESTNPSPLNLPPPAITIRTNPIIGRRG